MEGTQDGQIAIVGIGYFDSGQWVLEQHVVERSLQPFVEYSQRKSRDVRCSELADVLKQLNLLISERSGDLVAFSRHEDEVLPGLAQSLGVTLAYRYRNARSIAKPWARRTHPEALPRKHSRFDPGSGYSLEFFLGLIEYPVPVGSGTGHTGNRLRELRDVAQAGKKLTSTRKAKWTKLLSHNRHDVEGLRELMRQVGGMSSRMSKDVES